MTPRVVVADQLASEGIDLLQQHLEVLQPLDGTALHTDLMDSQALVVRSRTKVTADLLDRGSQLQLVARAGIGVDNVDISAATERGVLVINSPMGNVRSTAEHTIALIFALARRVPAADSAVRAGRWKAGYEGLQIAGKTLGVIGIGKVGRTVASMGLALGMDVVAHDPYISPDVWPQPEIRSMSLQEVLQVADIVTLHIPLSTETRGILSAENLSMCRPSALVVNCARGGLVDEAALADALQCNRLAGAALDVFEEEPLGDSPLLNAPNLILTPHVAASTPEAQLQVSTDIAVQVVNFFRGYPVTHPINPSVLEKA